VPIPDNAPPYGKVTDYTEPILQRRLMVVTDDYVVLADYLKGEKEHTFDALLQMKGFQGLEAPNKKLLRHTGQWDANPLSSAQFVTDCDWYEVSAPARGSYAFRFGPGADNGGTWADASEDGVLNMDVHTVWPRKQELMIGTPPETHGVNQQVTYAVRGDGKAIKEGKTGTWVLGDVAIDVPVEDVKVLELETRASGSPTLFWAGGIVVTADGKEIPLANLSVKYDNTLIPKEAGKDYAGGPIKIAGMLYEQATPAQPKDGKQPSSLRIDLSGTNAMRFKCVLGGDFPVGDETQRRKTVAVRQVGTSARFLTVLEPFEDKRMIRRAEAINADKLRVELIDGRVQEIELSNFTDAGGNVAVRISEIDKDGKPIRSESTEPSHANN
jgi:hypothetical protein